MWNEVQNVLLESNRAPIVQTAMDCHPTTNEDHDGGEIQRVKGDPGNHGARIHQVDWKTKNVCAVAQISFQFKVHPTEYQGKGDEGRNNAAPHYQLMHQPA